MKKLPLTIVSGFSGSEKIKFFRQLLIENYNYKIAVLIEDISDINLSFEFVQNKTDDMVEFENGCACYAIKTDIFNTIQKIYHSGKYDGVFLESNGVADPGNLAINFEMDERIGISLADISYVDNIITVIDGEKFLSDFFRPSYRMKRKEIIMKDPCLKFLLIKLNFPLKL